MELIGEAILNEVLISEIILGILTIPLVNYITFKLISIHIL